MDTLLATVDRAVQGFPQVDLVISRVAERLLHTTKAAACGGVYCYGYCDYSRHQWWCPPWSPVQYCDFWAPNQYDCSNAIGLCHVCFGCCN
jgi:hypothetical protein